MQKGGGKMADAGSVMFSFQRQGIILVEPSVAEDEVCPCLEALWQVNVQTWVSDGRLVAPLGQ